MKTEAAAAPVRQEQTDLVATIHDACRRAQEQGVTIVSQDWGLYVEDGLYRAEGREFGKPRAGEPLGVCPLGAVLLGRRRTKRRLDAEIEQALGVSVLWTAGFRHGYDGDHLQEETVGANVSYECGFHVGARIRELVPPGAIDGGASR